MEMEKRLSDAAEALFAAAGFHSIGADLDGFIPNEMLFDLEDYDEAAVEELVAAERWEEAEGGYQMVNIQLVEKLKREREAMEHPDGE